MATAVAAVICLALGGFVGYVTGAVLTSNKYIDKMEVLWHQLRNSTRRIGELESKLKSGGAHDEDHMQ